MEVRERASAPLGRLSHEWHLNTVHRDPKDNSRTKDRLDYWLWLARLAEKGKITQKLYGMPTVLCLRRMSGSDILFPPAKMTFFVANQANLEDMPKEKLDALEKEYKEIDEQIKALQTEAKSLSAGE